jgi:hypothetical protein
MRSPRRSTADRSAPQVAALSASATVRRRTPTASASGTSSSRSTSSNRPCGRAIHTRLPPARPSMTTLQDRVRIHDLHLGLARVVDPHHHVARQQRADRRLCLHRAVRELRVARAQDDVGLSLDAELSGQDLVDIHTGEHAEPLLGQQRRHTLDGGFRGQRGVDDPGIARGAGVFGRGRCGVHGILLALPMQDPGHRSWDGAPPGELTTGRGACRASTCGAARRPWWPTWSSAPGTGRTASSPG